MIHPNIRQGLLTVYDTIHIFGNSPFTRLHWTQTFAWGIDPKSAERRMARMDALCSRWDIPLQRWSSEGRAPSVVRRFTLASKHRVDHLLGPVLSSVLPESEDVLRGVLAPIASCEQEKLSGCLRDAPLGGGA
jgi:hypothetical protein